MNEQDGRRVCKTTLGGEVRIGICAIDEAGHRTERGDWATRNEAGLVYDDTSEMFFLIGGEASFRLRTVIDPKSDRLVEGVRQLLDSGADESARSSFAALPAAEKRALRKQAKKLHRQIYGVRRVPA